MDEIYEHIVAVIPREHLQHINNVEFKKIFGVDTPITAQLITLRSTPMLYDAFIARFGEKACPKRTATYLVAAYNRNAAKTIESLKNYVHSKTNEEYNKVLILIKAEQDVGYEAKN